MYKEVSFNKQFFGFNRTIVYLQIPAEVLEKYGDEEAAEYYKRQEEYEKNKG